MQPQNESSGIKKQNIGGNQKSSGQSEKGIEACNEGKLSIVP